MSYDIDFGIATSSKIERSLCKRLENIRLSRNWTRKMLADESGLSDRTIANMEGGKGVSFDTFIRVLIAFGIQSNLDMLLPDPSIRPMERITHSGNKERRRARQVKEKDTAKWEWGDEGKGIA